MVIVTVDGVRDVYGVVLAVSPASVVLAHHLGQQTSGQHVPHVVVVFVVVATYGGPNKKQQQKECAEYLHVSKEVEEKQSDRLQYKYKYKYTRPTTRSMPSKVPTIPR